MPNYVFTSLGTKVEEECFALNDLFKKTISNTSNLLQQYCLTYVLNQISKRLKIFRLESLRFKTFEVQVKRIPAISPTRAQQLA